MVSEELLAFNSAARERKPFLSSDYDPVEVRRALFASGSAPRGVMVEAGQASIEFSDLRSTSPIVVAIAGGGFCFPPGDHHRDFLDNLTQRIGARWALVHHRLAPEHPFPAAYDDTLCALDRVLSNEGAAPVSAIADSSGAALLLSALCTRRDRGETLPERCVLLSPLTDLAMTGRSHVANSQADPMFGPEAIIHKGMHYLQGANPTDPRASPLWADAHGLPRMLVIAGDTEVMRDDAVRYAEKVNASQGSAELELVHQAPHVFPLTPLFPEAERARERIAAFLTSSGKQPDP
jgi:acetyl esterase/lipase